jgi:predicted outer membrane protein
MRKSGLIKLMIISAAISACASGGAGTGTTTSSTSGTGGMTTSSSGEVTASGGGLWNDGTDNGMWMDTTGAMRMGGRRGRMMGLQSADISRLNDQNIVAHLATGDSLEIALSQVVVSRAQNGAVRDFAQRMIREHTDHMQMGRQLATQNGITPMPAAFDTMDVTMASRMLNRLSNGASNGMSSNSSAITSGTNTGMTDGDRQLMTAEVAMHRHMLHELTMLQPQASGAARQLVDQTIPVVRQHLTDAESVWRQVGGGNSRR